MAVTEQQKNIPKGWAKESLDYFGTCIRGVSYSPKDLRFDKDENSINLLRANNIKDGYLNFDNLQIVSKEKVKETQFIKKEDVFICMSSGSKKLVGKNVFIDEVIKDYTIGAFCALYRASGKKEVSPYFIKQLFSSNQYNLQIQNSLQGSNINNLKNSQIENLNFSFPPLNEQQKIAGILGTVDKEIEKTDEVIEKTKKLKKGLTDEIFGAKNIKNKKWKIVKLNEIAKVERGKFSHRPRNAPEFYNGEYPFIQTGDVSNCNGQIDKYNQTLNKRGLEISRIFKKGTIVLTIAANIGDIGVLEFDSCFPDSLVGITVNDDVNNTFLKYFLETQKNYLNSIATKSAQKNINLQKLNPMKVVKPLLSEQQKIAETLSAVDEKILVNKKLKEKLTQLKKGLMQDLLNGKVRVNN